MGMKTDIPSFGLVWEPMSVFLRRQGRKLDAGMAACIGFIVGIPLTFLIVYGVGYRGWNPIWAAPVLLLVPLLVMGVSLAVSNRGNHERLSILG